MQCAYQYPNDQYTNAAIGRYNPPIPPEQLSQFQLYSEKQRLDYEKEQSLICSKVSADVDKYWAKTSINQASLTEVMKVRADIQIKKDMLSEEIVIDEGRLRRKQEFMLEAGKEYSLANFSIAGRPLKLTTPGENRAILFLEVWVEEEKKALYFDLARTEAGYYKKRFRNSGIIFKKRRKDGDELFFDVIGAIMNLADTVEMPKEYGFYAINGQLFYADRKMALWKEALENAK